MFRLVLQFRPWEGRAFDDLVSVEDQLITALKNVARVDGHDMGSGEANIFIDCMDPGRTLARCMPIIEEEGLLSVFSAAHRPLDGDEYTRVWPKGDKSGFEVK